MSIYRRKFKAKDRDGNPVVRQSKRYTAEFSFGGQLYKRSGFIDRETARYWLDSTRLRLSRGEVGMVKPLINARAQQLVDEYADHLIEIKRDDEYAYIVRVRLTRLAKECPWMTLGDITIESFDRWRRSKPRWRNRLVGGRTLNQYLDHAKDFCTWLVGQRKLAVNPLATAARVTAPTNDRYRRAATLDELTRLLATCPEERRLQYMFRLYVPLRRDSIRRMTWGDLHLDATPPWGECDAWSNKSRRRIKFAIRYDLAQHLRVTRGKALNDDEVFNEVLSVDELREDLQRAEIPFDDSKGNRRLDFHAFRRTFIKLAKAAGVPMETAHLALHHADMRTTRKHYDDDSVEPPLTDAAERLPVIGTIKIARIRGANA